MKLEGLPSKVNILDCSDATIYMSIRNWASEKLCSGEFLGPVHHEKNLSNAPGNLVFWQKDQPRFVQNCLCKYWEIFKADNEWIPLQTTPKNH